MITALLIESWDIYSMAFILFALKDIYEPSAWLLGFTAAGTQLGAVIGALLGGWLTDKLGRRKIFLWSMILFAIFALPAGAGTGYVLAGDYPLPRRDPSGCRRRERLYLHHGSDAERQARGHG